MKVPWYYDERWHQRAMSAGMLLGLPEKLENQVSRLIKTLQNCREARKPLHKPIKEFVDCGAGWLFTLLRISSCTFLAHSSLWSCMPRLRRYREIHPLQRCTPHFRGGIIIAGYHSSSVQLNFRDWIIVFAHVFSTLASHLLVLFGVKCYRYCWSSLVFIFFADSQSMSGPVTLWLAQRPVFATQLGRRSLSKKCDSRCFLWSKWKQVAVTVATNYHQKQLHVPHIAQFEEHLFQPLFFFMRLLFHCFSCCGFRGFSGFCGLCFLSLLASGFYWPLLFLA